MGNNLAAGAFKLVMLVIVATLAALILLLLLGPWLLMLVILVIAVFVAWRLFPSLNLPKINLFRWFRLLCALIRELPRLSTALEATSGALRAAATGLSTGKRALDRIEADLSSSGALLKTVKLPVPPPTFQTKSLRDVIHIDDIPGLDVDDVRFVTGLTFAEANVLSAAGDLLIRQANGIHATSGLIDQQVTTLNDAAQVLHDVAQALKAADS